MNWEGNLYVLLPKKKKKKNQLTTKGSDAENERPKKLKGTYKRNNKITDVAAYW